MRNWGRQLAAAVTVGAGIGLLVVAVVGWYAGRQPPGSVRDHIGG